MKWNEKVKELMNQKNINQKDLSAMSGITEASICRYLKGDRTPRIDIIVNFAKALDTDIEFLLDEDKQIMSPFESISLAISRKGNELSEEEKKQLVELILGKDN